MSEWDRSRDIAAEGQRATMVRRETEMSKAEKLARAMDGVLSGGRSFNRQLAAQVRDELRRLDRQP